jgi:hypothetical protein
LQSNAADDDLDSCRQYIDIGAGTNTNSSIHEVPYIGGMKCELMIAPIARSVTMSGERKPKPRQSAKMKLQRGEEGGMGAEKKGGT